MGPTSVPRSRPRPRYPLAPVRFRPDLVLGLTERENRRGDRLADPGARMSRGGSLGGNARRSRASSGIVGPRIVDSLRGWTTLKSERVGQNCLRWRLDGMFKAWRYLVTVRRATLRPWRPISSTI